MRSLLKEMAEGDLSGEPIQLRKKDELEKLYRAIVHNHAQWRFHITEMMDVFDLAVDSDEKVRLLRDKVFSFKVEGAE